MHVPFILCTPILCMRTSTCTYYSCVHVHVQMYITHVHSCPRLVLLQTWFRRSWSISTSVTTLRPTRRWPCSQWTHYRRTVKTVTLWSGDWLSGACALSGKCDGWTESSWTIYYIGFIRWKRNGASNRICLYAHVHVHAHDFMVSQLAWNKIRLHMYMYTCWLLPSK